MKRKTTSVKLDFILSLGIIQKFENGFKFTYYDYDDKDFIDCHIDNISINTFINRIYKIINN